MEEKTGQDTGEVLPGRRGGRREYQPLETAKIEEQVEELAVFVAVGAASIRWARRRRPQEKGSAG